MARIILTQRIGTVEFRHNRVIEILIGLIAHRNHATIAIAGKDHRPSTLHIVSNLRKLVAQIRNRTNVGINCSRCCHLRLLSFDDQYLIIITIFDASVF